MKVGIFIIKGCSMNKMVAVVFKNETDAYNGLTGLKGLHIKGDITLYEDVVIEKDASGTVSVKEGSPVGPIGTALGVTLGGLVGLLGGPLGALAGAYGGSFAGMMYDFTNAGVDAEFIDDVSKAMVPGTVALLADIDEQWTAPLDTQMMDTNGIVFRKLREEVEDDQIEREVEATREDLEHLESEWKESADDVKANVQKHIDNAKAKMKALADRAKEKLDNADKKFDAKMETLKKQRNDAKEENKEKIDKTIEKLKTDHTAHTDKLKRAYDAAKAELDK